jgi:hypothetical protein
MKNCYTLNLPEFDQVKLDNFDIDRFFTTHRDNLPSDRFLFYISSNLIFKKDFLNLLKSKTNIKFSNTVCFYKEKMGGIHIDSSIYNPENPSTEWGINWNIGSSAVYNFWDFQDMSESKLWRNEKNRLHSVFKTEKSPREIYLHTLSNPVLFNASYPHQAGIQDNNIGSRYSISLRPIYYDISWAKVFDAFKEYILDY